MAVASAAGRPASGLGRVLQFSDVFLGVAVVVIVGLMIVPLPTLMIDLLVAINIATALTILLVAMYITEPLQFSVFPSLLLIVTLFRLGLNVAATRLILLQADAGRIIESFGAFVVGGNYVVGIVVFLILMVIQFVVITNGAGRVAEVAARFTLDAMPGKQMAIDADLNAGLINEDQARERRRRVEQHADFYGAMDGASKFVKGDAIAAIVIVFVNILGGFGVGVMQLGMPLPNALKTYTLLTVGDGLVSQIPALLISTATGIIVTRAASESNLGHAVLSELLSNPRALALAGGVLLLLGLIPGLPKPPFFVVGGVLAGGAYLLSQQQRAAAEAAAVAPPAEAPKEPDNVLELLQVDPMELEIGYGLIPLVDASRGGNLLQRITLIRRQLALELGIILPTIRVRDNLQLRPNAYGVKLRGVEIARGELMVNHFLAMNPGGAEDALNGTPTVEPAFGLPAQWIPASQREQAEMLGYTVVDPASVLTTHLTEVIKVHAPSIMGRQATQALIDNLKREHPALIEELIPGLLTLGEVQKVLQNLLRERVSIRDLVTILETLADRARATRDTDLLSEHVRHALQRPISYQYKDEGNIIRALLLSPRLEETLGAALQPTEQGMMINLDPTLGQRLLQRLAREAEKMASVGLQPVVLCSSRIRLPLKRFTERALRNLGVLSFGEIAPQVEVHSQGLIGLEEA